MTPMRHARVHRLALAAFVILTLVFIAAGCGFFRPATESQGPPAPEASAYPLMLTDDIGREVTFESAPEKVVTIAPSATELVFAIGAGDRIVATDDFSDYPE